MSGQAGIFYFDGRPISPAMVDFLERSIEQRGPDGGGRHLAPGLAMVSRAFHVSKEDALEQQPFISRTGHVATWDGRLDNRDDLLLQIGQTAGTDTTDVALATAAFARWNDQGLHRLIGDWSLALWEPSARTLLLASDYMGTRPLFYHSDGERLVWSSSLNTVVRATHRENDLEKRFIAGFLTMGPPPDVTPYRGIFCVPAGHSLRFAANGECEDQRFWDVVVNTIRYCDQATYEEHLRQVFREAIRSRLRVNGTAWAELSGGWDSSAVVCMAHTILQTDTVQARALRTISYVTPGSPESDETRFVEAVEQHTGIKGHHINIDRFERDPVVSWVSPVGTLPQTGHALELVRAGNGRLVLTGRLGDGVMGSIEDYSISLADYLASGNLIGYVRQARAWSLATRKPIVQLIPPSVQLLLPSSMRERIARRDFLRKAAKRRKAPRLDLQHTHCIHPSLVTRLEEIYPSYTAMLPRVWPPSKRDLARALVQAASTRRLMYPEADVYVEFTHPYVDRRVVEYALAIPTDVLCRPGETRSLMRRAFAGFLPDRIARRFSKGYAAPTVARSLRGAMLDWVDRVDDLEIVKRGYVAAEPLAAQLKLTLSGSGSLNTFLAMLGLEKWLRTRTLDSNAMTKGGEIHDLREARAQSRWPGSERRSRIPAW